MYIEKVYQGAHSSTDNLGSFALHSFLNFYSISMGGLRAVRTAVWGAPAATKAERKLIVKLDTFILSSCCLQYWVN